MTQANILERLAVKGADIAELAGAISSAAEVRLIMGAFLGEESAKKYAYEKALRLVSEKHPELVYPYFSFFDAFLKHDNKFIKWGSIRTLANLTPVDSDKQFDAIFARYYGPIKGPEMVTAANIIGCTTIIVRAKPALADAVVSELLKVEKGKYYLKRVLSPECKNVAIGHAIDAFSEIFPVISDKPAVCQFVRRQLKNSRKPVAKRAEKFLRLYGVPK